MKENSDYNLQIYKSLMYHITWLGRNKIRYITWIKINIYISKADKNIN